MGVRASTQGQEATQQRPRPVSNSPSSISGDQGSSAFVGEGSSGILNPTNGLVQLLQQASHSSSASDPCIDPHVRTRRFASFSDAQPINIHTSSNSSSGRTNSTSVATGVSASRYFDSDSSPEDSPFLANMFQRHGASSQSLPIHLMNLSGLKCPICSKQIAREEIEFHLVLCLTKPRVSYNEDVMSSSGGGECVICLEEMICGDTIARLPCLCIYHKECIDDWFKRSRTCPEHPPTD